MHRGSDAAGTFAAGCEGRRRERIGTKMDPQPNSVWYNDWRQVDVEPLETFTPTQPVSVIVPCHQTPAAMLARTLASLEGQTCPRNMFEVLIVDDGSDPPLTRLPSTPLDVKVVRRERGVFGNALTRSTAGQARDAGVRAAAHDILLFVDSTMLVEADWMAAHSRWHHAVSDALTVGVRAHVDVSGLDAEMIRSRPGTLRELLSDRPADPPRYERQLAETDGLTSRADDPFQMVVAGNLGIRKRFYRELGGFEESFTFWGFEDVELGYRAYTGGGLLVPVRHPVAWRQGRWRDDRDAKLRSTRIQRGIAAQFIADPWYRDDRPGRIFTVPRYVVTVDAGRWPVQQVIGAVDNVLTDRARDLVVRIEVDAGEDDERLMRLRAEFGRDARVRVAPERDALDAFPASAFHVALPAAAVGRNLVHRLRKKLGDAATAASILPGGAAVSITRAWALHRARRTGKEVAAFGEARTVSAAALKLTAADPPDDAARGGRSVASCAARWRRRMGNGGGFGAAWSVLKRRKVTAWRWMVEKLQ